VKEFLSREGYAFVEKNVEEDEMAYSELIAMGVRTIPLTVIADRRVKGYDERALREALAAAAGS
jgi:glutaredoxin